MDKSKQPGIKFERVFLSKLKYELPAVEPGKFKYDINLASSYKIDGEKLIYSLTLKLYDKFELEITGIFTTIKGKENLSLDKFADINAPILLVPFLREILSNITSRTPLPHLLLPPINISALRKKAETAESSLQ